MSARDLSRRLLLRFVGASSVAPSLRLFGRGLLSIFTLHRFADPELGVGGHDPAALRDHLAYLRRYRYRLLSLAEVLRRVEDGYADSTAPAVAFTVDDGYADFARVAAPIFAEYDCPVTLFVTTGFVDGQLWMWWDRVTYLFQHTRRCSLLLDLPLDGPPYRWSTPGERDEVRRDLLCRLEWVDAPERDATIADLSRQLDVELPARPPSAFAPITWDDVRRTARRGSTFGPHTVTHPILSLGSDEACRREIEESYRRLREETDASVPVFCFPNGEPQAFGHRELEAVQRAGFRAALTTMQDYAIVPGRRLEGGLGRFALPRFPYPDDRPHLVHIISGLRRLKRLVQSKWRTAAERVPRFAVSGSCAGLLA